MSVPNKIINKELYKKVREEVKKEIPKHSAYRSMTIIKEYKKRGGKIDNKYDEKKSGLNIWNNEKWKNLTPYAEGIVNSINESPPCGKKHPKQQGPSVCRPTKKINKDTPKLASNYNKKQIKKAVEIKNKGKIIKWGKL